ncbi:MAG: hypothetical protein D6714_20245 [Bacteroidetes bacterium]|nr:MAG: hypothetical protein D6714_20245 [Bacteroidota bacterium]
MRKAGAFISFRLKRDVLLCQKNRYLRPLCKSARVGLRGKPRKQPVYAIVRTFLFDGEPRAA